jgi:hypothetical protein
MSQVRRRFSKLVCRHRNAVQEEREEGRAATAPKGCMRRIFQNDSGLLQDSQPALWQVEREVAQLELSKASSSIYS